MKFYSKTWNPWNICGLSTKLVNATVHKLRSDCEAMGPVVHGFFHENLWNSMEMTWTP